MEMKKVTLSENLDESAHFTVKLIDDIGNLILLIILGIIPIINFVVAGYGAEIIRGGEELDKPPKLSEFGKLFIDGLKIAIAALLYALVPLLIGTIVGIMFAVPFKLKYYPELPTIFSLLWLYPVLAVTSLVGILFAIFGVMGILHMIRMDEFGKAFAFSEILKLIETVGWGEYLIWLIIMYVIGSIVAWLSAANFIVGAILSVFYIVFAARSAYHIYPKG